MASYLQLCGDVHVLLGSLSQAEADFAQARRYIEGVVRDNPKVIEYRYIQGEIYSFLGRVLAEQGRTTSARAVLQKAIALEREQLRLNPTTTEFLMCLAERDSILAGLERETDHFDLAVNAFEETLLITNKERHEPVPNQSVHKIHFHTIVESIRLTARKGESLTSRTSTLRTLLQELEEKKSGGPLTREDRRMAVEGYLTLAEDAERSGRVPEVLEALVSADSNLDVLLSATPGQPRLICLKATIEIMRGSALAVAGQGEKGAAAAERAVAILEKLTAADPSYFYRTARPSASLPRPTPPRFSACPTRKRQPRTTWPRTKARPTASPAPPLRLQPTTWSPLPPPAATRPTSRSRPLEPMGAAVAAHQRPHQHQHRHQRPPPRHHRRHRSR